MGGRTAAWSIAFLVLLAGAARADEREERAADAKKAAFDLAEAAKRGTKEAGSGTPFHVELERDKGRLVWSVDVSQGTKTCNVVLDAASGAVLEKEVEDEDHSAAVAASKTTLLAAVDAALRTIASARALEAHLVLQDGKPAVTVRMVSDASLSTARVDAVTGAVVSVDAKIGPGRADPVFTDSFPVEPGELVSTGRNPWFVLVPGHVLVLAGKEDGKDLRLTVTVTSDVKVVDGVETRVVEEREEKGGVLVEVSRNYFAISKRSNCVYYFGEDVDIYVDGKVARHDGAWHSGVDGARFGLMMPGTPLLGARYHQEVAPGVAMDRAEVTTLDARVTTPAGVFERCLVTDESTPLEKGVETKRYAAGVGLVSDGEVSLVSVTQAK
jgi:uncharacterized membrane protein YkoI